LSTLSSILRDDVRPLLTAAPEAPEQLAKVIDRCLRKSPDERWQTMKDVQMALSALKHESDSGMLYRSRLTEIPTVIEPPAGYTRGSAGQDSTTTVIAPPGATQQNPRFYAGQDSTTILPPGATQQNAIPAGQMTQQAPIAQAAPQGSKVLYAVIGGIGLMTLLGVGGWMMLNQRKALETPPVAVVSVPAAPPVEVPPVPPDTGLTNDLIIEMVQNKLSTSLILSQIRSEKNSFVLSGAEVIRLAKAGVPESVIEGMRHPDKIPEQPKPPVQTAVVNPPANKQNPSGSASSTPATPAPPASVAVPPPAAQTPPPPPPEAVPAKPAPPAMQAITDGAPLVLILSEDIPASADKGAPVHLTVSSDFAVGDVVVVAKGTPVTGSIVEKKGLVKSMQMRIDSTTSTGGQKILLRAASGSGQRPVETGTKSKDIAAMAGTSYNAYVNGNQTVQVKH
jgi:hypothetical protein